MGNNFHYGPELTKQEVAEQFKKDLSNLGYTVTEVDFERPWGGFLRIADNQVQRFINEYFSGVEFPKIPEGTTLSPKFLIVEPGQKLSWQVHERRGEFWRVVDGPVGTFLSETDEQPVEPEIYNIGDTIHAPVGTRHRLVGLEQRGIVAEIWIHVDPANLSDEADIKRITDDYGRSN